MRANSLSNTNIAIDRTLDTKYDDVKTVADNIALVEGISLLEANGKLDDVITAGATATVIINMTVATGPEGSEAQWDGITGTLTIPVGDTGTAGATWLSGSVDPTTQGTDNDFYLNTISYNYFKKVTGTWTLQGSLKGIQGDPGPQGIQGDTGLQGEQGIQGIQGVQGIQGPTGNDGSTWLNGTANPTTQGNDGDYFINTVSSDYFYKVAGSWILQGNLKGNTGDTGLQGIAGIDGDTIDHISRTIGNGAPGTTDTYTVWGDVGETNVLGTFQVYNGANGTGAGDLLAVNNLSELTNYDTARANLGLKTIYDNISVTTPVDLDALEVFHQAVEARYVDTNEPTGFIREFRETNGVMELCIGAGLVGYTNSKVIRVDHNSQTTILDTTTFYDGSPVADRTFRIMPLAYTGNVDIINEETGGLENRADTRDTSVNGGAYYSIYVEGVKANITTGQSIQFPNQSGLQFVYHTTGGTLALAQTFSFEYFEDRPITCTVYGNAVDFQLVNFGDERHGIQMDGFTHRYLHFTEGTRYISGMEVNGLAAGGTTYTNIGSGKAYDEDIYILPDSQTNAPHLWTQWDATEAKNVWRVEDDATDIAYVPVANAVWNENVAGQYQLTDITGNDVGIIFFVLTNNREYPYVKIVGQEVYTSVSEARANVANAINSLVTTGLPSPEFLPIAAIMVNASGELVTLADGSTHVDLRTAKISGSGTTSIPVSAHNDLTNRDSADAHPISAITGLQVVLDGKVDDAQVLTDVPAGAVFTDTTYPEVTATTGGVLTDVQAVKFDGIETGATADQLAVEVPYTNATSGLVATEVQSAIDEIDGRVDAIEGAGYISGNEVITLSGDATGSGTTSIAVTVLDDSHNHNSGTIILGINGLTDVDTATVPPATGQSLLWNGVSTEWEPGAVLVPSDIGGSVQGYDANTTKYNDPTANFTGTLQNGGSNVVVDSDIGVNVQPVLQPRYSQVADVSLGTGTHTFDYSTGNYQKVTATGNITLATSNFVAGKFCVYRFEATNFGNFSITIPATWETDNKAAPTFTTDGTDVWEISKDKDEVYTLTLVTQNKGTVA